MTALRIRVDNLARYVRPDGVAEHRLVLEETDRLAKILEGLLALARADGEQQPLVEVDAGRVADERIAAWQPLATSREIELRRAGVATATVHAVATGVDQALDALIDNALKFGGSGVIVLIRVERVSTGVDVHVIDDGPGMSSQECALAPQRLWRAPTAQNVQGAGLGLPTAAVLMAASGGEVVLEPGVPRGLRATLRFTDGDRS